MWTHRSWMGTTIPASTAAGSELNAYARVVNAVEGNTTFYATPQRETAARWAESVPDGFRFMFKLPRTVTHDRKLRGVRKEVGSFLVAMEPLHHLMEPIAIQLPASFGPESLETLDEFLGSVSSEFRWAVEVRDPEFFESMDQERHLNDVLHHHGADRIVLDSRAVFGGPRLTAAEHEAFENKPRLPARAVAINDRPVVRFIGQTSAEANPPYWAPWVTTVARWLQDGRRPMFFIHTPDNVVAPQLCRQFHDEVAALVPDLSPLPEPPPSHTPGLFD